MIGEAGIGTFKLDLGYSLLIVTHEPRRVLRVRALLFQTSCGVEIPKARTVSYRADLKLSAGRDRARRHGIQISLNTTQPYHA